MEPSKPRILIIDDDTDYLAFVQLTLERVGFGVRQANDGDEGLEALEETRPDLILVDYKMPRLSGERFVIQARTKFKGIPIVVLSNYTDAASTQEFFLKIGARQVFSKSIRTPDLVDGIKEVLRAEGWSDEDLPPDA